MHSQHQDHASSTSSTHPTTDGIDPFFVCDWDPVDDLSAPADAPPEAEAPRFTTYWDVERGCRGPDPVPGWVVTDAAAVDTDLGVLKTGKEADVLLLSREATDGSGARTVMAAKRYRGTDHRTFHRSSAYTEGRRTRRSRDQRALARKSSYGRAVEAGRWAFAEWEALCNYWSIGLPVPYPVQIDGTEILMELIEHEGQPAPRLVQERPSPDLLAEYFEQLRTAIAVLAAQGVAHGDLSAYNILAAGDRVVIIDLPQVIDLVANPRGPEFLLRDCRNVCSWFVSRGLDVDPHELFATVAPA